MRRVLLGLVGVMLAATAEAVAAFGIVSGFIILAAIAAPVLAQGPVHAKVTVSSEDFARNRASFVGQTVEIQLCRAEGALMFKFDCIVQDGDAGIRASATTSLVSISRTWRAPAPKPSAPR